MVRIVAAAFAASFLKMVAMLLYSAWAIKIGLLDSNMNPLFAIAMVGLSIIGLWIIVGRAAERMVVLTNRDRAGRTQ
jgi:hypothetical protein